MGDVRWYILWKLSDFIWTIEFTENTEKNQTTENTDDQDNNENDIPFIDPSVYTYKKKKSVKKYVNS